MARFLKIILPLAFAASGEAIAKSENDEIKRLEAEQTKFAEHMFDLTTDEVKAICLDGFMTACGVLNPVERAKDVEFGTDPGYKSKAVSKAEYPDLLIRSYEKAIKNCRDFGFGTHCGFAGLEAGKKGLTDLENDLYHRGCRAGEKATLACANGCRSGYRDLCRSDAH